MQTYHVFFRAHEDAKRKDTEVKNKQPHSHVKINFEDHFWSNNGLCDELVDEFII